MLKSAQDINIKFVIFAQLLRDMNYTYKFYFNSSYQIKKKKSLTVRESFHSCQWKKNHNGLKFKR